MKLISMSDFVVEQELMLRNNSDYTNTEAIIKIFNYANFIKQYITLGMFFPCDLNGNLLDYPDHNYNSMQYMDEFDVYNEAKSRVLFEGFKETICEGKTYLHNHSFGSVFIDKNWAIRHCFVEDLIGIELTKSAI
jgi:hypothetical protein